jgi:hypothetical protein
MSDSHNNDPFSSGPTGFEPQRFDPPVSDPAPPGPPADALLPSDPAAAATAHERLALDSTSLWLNRLGEELVAWLKTLYY